MFYKERKFITIRSVYRYIIFNRKEIIIEMDQNENVSDDDNDNEFKYDNDNSNE